MHTRSDGCQAAAPREEGLVYVPAEKVSIKFETAELTCIA